MIVVRPATLADIESISDLLIASITALCVADHHNRAEVVARWLANKTPDGVRQWLENPETTLLVAERNGSLAGVGSISVKRRILLNYVSPEHRYAGVSSNLLDTMEIALGPGEASLDSTKTAHRFYLRRGWLDSGRPAPWAGMLAYPMRKAL